MLHILQWLVQKPSTDFNCGNLWDKLCNFIYIAVPTFLATFRILAGIQLNWSWSSLSFMSATWNFCKDRFNNSASEVVWQIFFKEYPDEILSIFWKSPYRKIKKYWNDITKKYIFFIFPTVCIFYICIFYNCKKVNPRLYILFFFL